jgi:hypothetical protein
MKDAVPALGEGDDPVPGLLDKLASPALPAHWLNPHGILFTAEPISRDQLLRLVYGPPTSGGCLIAVEESGVQIKSFAYLENRLLIFRRHSAPEGMVLMQESRSFQSMMLDMWTCIVYRFSRR